MKSICYVVPYYGKLPSNFQLWLNSCYFNKNVNWLIFTNDNTNYNYPSNVKRILLDFSELQEMFQSKFDFKIKIDTYWCLSLFKPAYGEIFSEYLKKYDYWGHCDLDLMWGKIRDFITEDILNKYEKIGFQGHSTIYKNTSEVNNRYKTIIPNEINYIDVFSGNSKFSFDEIGMEKIYNYLNIPYYKETNFAHLSKYDYSFYLKYLPKEWDYKNSRQVFVWNKGDLIRYYLNQNKKICSEKYMYIHFFCRPMKFKVKNIDVNSKYIIYPDKMVDLDFELNEKILKSKGKCSKFKYYVTSLYYNRKKLTLKKIYDNILRMIEWKIQNNK